jgi:hypothetical protein
MMDQFVSLVVVRFIPTLCNIQISHSIRLTRCTMTLLKLIQMLHQQDSQILRFNIFLRAFNSTMMQWKVQFKEITQWKNFKIFP